MQVKNRLFPYPVINHNLILSNFGACDFQLLYEGEETDRAYILKNARFFTESKLINQLYDEGKIVVTCIVECSYTVYRKKSYLTREGKDIELPKVDFTERVDISMFATAIEDFTLASDEFDEDYTGIDFEIEKYDIIGANDGFNIRFKHEESEENLAASIFSIIISHDFEDGAYTVECNTGKKIVVTMSEKDYLNYKVIYTVPTFKEVFFNMLLVPALIEGLTQCRIFLKEDSSRDLEDVGNQYLWFRSIISSYKRLKGIDLTIDEFKTVSLSYFAQELLGKPLGSSLAKLVELTKGTTGGDDSE